MTSVAVLTPSLPGREALLAEAIGSVVDQTLRPDTHLIAIDHQRLGIGEQLNRLVRATDAEWLARLDDDDLFDPGHLATLVGSAGSADVVYSFCRVEPRPGPDGTPSPPEVLGVWWTPNQPFDAGALRRSNYIPATTLIRRSLWERIGGWSRTAPPPEGAGEDWDFWLRALDAGARFVCVPEVTWSYRYHGANVWFR